MKKEKLIKLAPLMILLIAGVYLLLDVAFTSTVLIKWHYVGLILLAIAIMAHLFNEKYGYWVTALLLFLGTISFAALTPTIRTYGLFYDGKSLIQIDLLFLATAILYLIIHRKEIPKWVIGD